MAKSPQEIGVSYREKFEIYLLTLTFSILGLSVQTAKFGSSAFQDSLELLGWLSLLVSGVVGIVRAEWVPVAYDIQGKIHTIERQRRDMIEASQRGFVVEVPFIEGGTKTVLSGQPAFLKFESLLSELELQFKETEAKVVRRYSWMRTGFVTGAVCLLVARGSAPVTNLLSAFCVWWTTSS
jgi:hypothetical protein